MVQKATFWVGLFFITSFLFLMIQLWHTRNEVLSNKWLLQSDKFKRGLIWKLIFLFDLENIFPKLKYLLNNKQENHRKVEKCSKALRISWDAGFLRPWKIRVAQNSCNLCYLITWGKDHQKICGSRFSIHKSVHLKMFWTHLETVHLQGSCGAM